MAVEACYMHIIGHKIFVRMKDIPMYLSKKTRDSIRNRYSHSIEVAESTAHLLKHVSRELGEGIDLDFMGVARIVGLVHDIGHTAFSHDGERILDARLKKTSADFPRPVRFNANLNNFRRIEKYGLFGMLPETAARYALASLLKRKKELKQYPEYRFIESYLKQAVKEEEHYLRKRGFALRNTTGRTILSQAMDLADENRYRVTDIIDALNIYSKEKLRQILKKSLPDTLTLKELNACVPFQRECMRLHGGEKPGTVTVKTVLIELLEYESHAKTEFQNFMNLISMAFNRNFTLDKKGKLVPKNARIETLRSAFADIAKHYIWGSKRVKKIKQPYNHYFETVVTYFIEETYAVSLIDSSSYRNMLIALKHSSLPPATRRYEELLLLRNFLGGLTNPKIEELYKQIKLLKLEKRYAVQVTKKERFLKMPTIDSFEKKLQRFESRIRCS